MALALLGPLEACPLEVVPFWKDFHLTSPVLLTKSLAGKKKPFPLRGRPTPSAVALKTQVQHRSEMENQTERKRSFGPGMPLAPSRSLTPNPDLTMVKPTANQKGTQGWNPLNWVTSICLSPSKTNTTTTSSIHRFLL